jgi:hypothetical protein
MKKILLIAVIIISIGLMSFRPPGVNYVTEIFNKIKDAATNAIRFLSYEHSEVHEGRHYTFCYTDSDFDIADTVAFIITVPDTTLWPHFNWEVTGALTTQVFFMENPTSDTVSGSAYTTYNSDRNSTNQPVLLIHEADANAISGDSLACFSFGISTGQGISTRAGGGSSRGGQERILKQNEQYLFWVVSGADNNNLTVRFPWYEHKNN